MKKLILGLTLAVLMLFSQSVLADSKPVIEAKVNGTIDQGQKIQILINISNISSLYTAQMQFKYDTSVLKINSIEQGDLISKPGINKTSPLINKIDLENGIATYVFTCVGQTNGFSGTGTFLKINAEVLKKDSFHINSKPFLKHPDSDMNLMLEFVSSDLNYVDYQFVPYVFSTGNTENTSNGGTTDSNTAAGTAADNSSSSSDSTNDANTVNSNDQDKSTDSSSQTVVNSNSPDTDKNVQTESKDSSSQAVVDNNSSGSNKNEKDKSKDNSSQTLADSNSSTDSNSSKVNNNEKQSDNKSADNTVSNNAVSSEKTNNMKVYAALSLTVILLGAAGVYIALKIKKRRNIDNNKDISI